MSASTLTAPDRRASDAGRVAPVLTVVVPVYNEAENVPAVLADLLPAAEAHGWEVLFVDDGSTDGTAAVLDAVGSPSARVVRHRHNRGYGAALKSGMRAAAAPSVACMDADGQHSVAELLKLVERIGEPAMIVGERPGMAKSPLWRVPGKWLLTMLARLLLGRRIPDLNSGLRVFQTDVIRRYLHLFPDGFSFSTTSTFVLLHRGYEVEWVPIEIAARGGRSVVGLGTGFQVLLLVFRLIMVLSPLRIFLPVGAVSIVAGVAWMIPYVLQRRGVTVASLLLILNGMLVTLFGLLADQIAALRKERFER